MRNLQRMAVVPLFFHLAVWSAGAQTFDAASLKPLAPLPPLPASAPSGEAIISERVVQTTAGSSPNFGVVSPGRLHAVGTLREFLANAYDVKEVQIEGPAWMATDRFVLDATMPPGTSRKQQLSMLQNLLADRFQLSAHRASKELPLYSLVVAKNGPKMKESPQVPAPAQATFRVLTTGGHVQITVQRETMQDWADQLAQQVDRPVKNETGMEQMFDFATTFSSTGSGAPKPSSDLPDTQDSPDLFSALQSQLGLRLEPKQGMVDVVVVDHCERVPSKN